MPSPTTIVETLGGSAARTGPPPSVESLRAQIREGLPYSALEAVMGTYALGRDELSEALHLPPRTLSRRKKEKVLQPDESDRLYRLARIAAQATEVLGSPERASAWLRRPSRALAGEEPLALLDTDLGAREVEAVLGRLEHGVFS